ncbi:MAG: hypothetical protein IT438_10150 [Phycisphaerales bacterium]|nr:hypothetical protein [Phycisphaerales bacterium]
MAFATVAGQQYLVRVGSGGEAGDAGHGTISLTRIPTVNFNGACRNGSGCTIRSLGACNLTGGGFQGIGTDCTPNPCGPPPCAADIDDSGDVTVQDIFDYLALYFAGC